MKVQSFLEADFCYLDETKTDLETLDMYLALDIVLHIDSKDTSHNISLDICEWVIRTDFSSKILDIY